MVVDAGLSYYDSEKGFSFGFAFKNIGAQLKAYEDELTKYTSDEMFADAINDLITTASNEGRAYIHIYYDKNGELKYVVVLALNIIPIYDTEHNSTLKSIIYYYTITAKSGDSEKQIHKVEWWSDEGVKFFTEHENGNYAFDYAAPHWTEKKYIDGEVRDERGCTWGRLPFVELSSIRIPFVFAYPAVFVSRL